MLDWSRLQFIHGFLDDQGDARINLDTVLGPGLVGATDLHVAWIGYHPDYPGIDEHLKRLQERRRPSSPDDS